MPRRSSCTIASGRDEAAGDGGRKTSIVRDESSGCRFKALKPAHEQNGSRVGANTRCCSGSSSPPTHRAAWGRHPRRRSPGVIAQIAQPMTARDFAVLQWEHRADSKKQRVAARCSARPDKTLGFSFRASVYPIVRIARSGAFAAFRARGVIDDCSQDGAHNVRRRAAGSSFRPARRSGQG